MVEDFKLALKIRAVEEQFLDMFSKSLLNGTVHTCIGQELSAVGVLKFLNKDDYVFSNHRCHGHYIAFTNDYRSLIDELMGKETGVCGGVGGSQHIAGQNFFSNGPQGSLMPVAVGAAEGLKRNEGKNISVCFIGDGTMGEGITYEALNLASIYKLPVVFVCENNMYAQSTSIEDNFAGSISKRAESFGLTVYETDTWNYDKLIDCTENAIANSRDNNPSFIIVNTYRLKAHSKGDDDRDLNEVQHYENIDILNNLIKDTSDFEDYYLNIKEEIKNYIKSTSNNFEMDKSDYLDYQKVNLKSNFTNHDIKIRKKQVNVINEFFMKSINNDDKIILIGEDIKDPYGGAFKVTSGLSSKFKSNIISTPISEAGITGMGIGLCLLGYKPFVEIMFGDFITYAYDQIISNASKFYHMYNKKVTVPIVIRTPMGGGRGYGPTHSQSIEKLFNGINNIQIVALNTLIDAGIIFQSLINYQHCTILIENKVDYGRLQNKMPSSVNYNFTKSDSEYPVIIGQPDGINTNLSIITYGGSVHPVLECIDELFLEYEIFPQIIVLTKIYPIDSKNISDLVRDSNYIVTVEESNVEGGFGSEIISSLIELNEFENKKYLRIGSENVPIPSTKSLEEKLLVSSDMIIKRLKEIL